MNLSNEDAAAALPSSSEKEDTGLKLRLLVAAQADRLYRMLAGNVPCLSLTIRWQWEVSPGVSDDGRAITRLTGLSSWSVAYNCAVVCTISSKGVAFQLALCTPRQNPKG